MHGGWFQDEDGRFIQDTEGPCHSCGDWAAQRYHQYGYWVCEQCYTNCEDPDDYIDVKEE